jgi:hypothetical protein
MSMERWIGLSLCCALGCSGIYRDENPTASQGADSSADASTGGDDGPVISGGASETGDEDETDTTGDEDSGGLRLDVGAEDTEGNGGEIAEVFGHSANVLYRMDPETHAVTTVGTLQGCTNSIIDIALDADSRMFGTSYSALYRIDRQTAQCTFVAAGSYPTSLSFVPAGTLDPEEEALVGYVDADYVRIDAETGDITTIGTLPGGLMSSGDLVSVIDGGTYLTVIGPGCEAGDCIIEIDPATGDLVHNYGVLPHRQVFGLAFWAGKAYGFARDGLLFEIEFLQSGSTTTTSIAIPGAPSSLEFFGAGSTTSAPPIAG